MNTLALKLYSIYQNNNNYLLKSSSMYIIIYKLGKYLVSLTGQQVLRTINSMDN